MARVLAGDIPRIRERIARISRRAEKLGLEPVALTFGPESDETLTSGKVVRVVEASVSYPLVKLAGWRLVGVTATSTDTSMESAECWPNTTQTAPRSKN